MHHLTGISDVANIFKHLFSSLTLSESRLPESGMLWPMLHINFFKKMDLFGCQVPLSQVLTVKEQENSFVSLLWYVFFFNISHNKNMFCSL